MQYYPLCEMGKDKQCINEILLDLVVKYHVRFLNYQGYNLEDIEVVA